MNIKKEIQKALNDQDFDKVLACFEENKAKTSSYLQLHVFHMTHDITRWKAIEYLGKLAGMYYKEEHDLFRDIIRRFTWQMCEEGGNVPWASPEVIGSVIANVEGNTYKDFIGPMFYHTGLNDICYAGLYWVLPQLMTYHPEKVEQYLPDTYEWFDNYDMPDMRGYVSIFFEQYPHEDAKKYLEKWVDDERPATLYVDGSVQELKVGDLAKKALEKCQ